MSVIHLQFHCKRHRQAEFFGARTGDAYFCSMERARTWRTPTFDTKWRDVMKEKLAVLTLVARSGTAHYREICRH